MEHCFLGYHLPFIYIYKSLCGTLHWLLKHEYLSRHWSYSNWRSSKSLSLQWIYFLLVNRAWKYPYVDINHVNVTRKGIFHCIYYNISPHQRVYISFLRQDALAKTPENRYHSDTYTDVLPGIENYRNVV